MMQTKLNKNNNGICYFKILFIRKNKNTKDNGERIRIKGSNEKVKIAFKPI